MIKSPANRPFASAAPSTLSAVTSPFTYTNTTGRLQCLVVSGGLLLTISLGGISLGLTSSSILVRPGDVVALTFTTAPTIRVMDIM